VQQTEPFIKRQRLQHNHTALHLCQHPFELLTFYLLESNCPHYYSVTTALPPTKYNAPADAFHLHLHMPLLLFWLLANRRDQSHHLSSVPT
jgi:hypothetical protein